MNKKVLIIASLIISVMVAYSSCKKKTVEPGNVEPNDTVFYYTEPTEDQLKVVTDLETKIYGAVPTAGTYEYSLYNRFNNKVDAYNDSTTEVIVVFNDYVQSLTDNDYIDLYKNWKNGGVLVLTNPTKDNYNQQFLIDFSNVAGWYMIDEFGWEGFTNEDLANLTKLIDRFKIYDNDDPNQGLYECVGFGHNSRYFCDNVSSLNSLETAPKVTPYHYGLLADECIDWIGTVSAEERPSFADMIACKDGVDDWIGALNDTYVSGVESLDIDNSYNFNTEITSGVYKEALMVRIMHDFNDNSDYYQIDQIGTVYNKKVFKSAGKLPKPTDWYHNKVTNSWFFNYMGGMTSQIYLDTEGVISILKIHPTTDNNGYSSSYSTTDGKTHTVTDSYGGGFSFGASGTNPGANFNYNVQNSVSNGTSHSMTIGHSHSINDISVTQNTVMVDGHKAAEWIYTTKEAYETHPGHWEAPLSKSDFNFQNSELIRVTAPSGDATVTCKTVLRYNMLESGYGTRYIDNPGNHIFKVNPPKRFKERWALQCVNYGDIQGNETLINNFETFVKDKIFGSQSQIFEISTRSESDFTDVVLMLESFMTDFRSYKYTLKARGFTGKYDFVIYCEKLNKEFKASFTVE